MVGIGSLFSGIGGLDLAVEAVFGGQVVWHSEVDPYACHVLQQWWPSVPNLGDVRAVSEFPAAEVLCGGFPCQDISSAGKREGLRGEHSGLWSEFVRAIRAVQPSVVVVENVGQLRNRGLDDVLGDLAEAGFDSEWTSVQAAHVGAPHRRERMFLLAYPDRDVLRLVAERLQLGSAKCWDAWARQARELVADTLRQRCSRLRSPHCASRCRFAFGDQSDGQSPPVVFPPRPDEGEAWARWSRESRSQPGVCRGAYGPATGLHARRRRGRLRCLGRGVVPQQAAAALLALVRQATSDGC